MTPYPNTPGWGQWFADRAQFAQEALFGLAQTVVETPKDIAHEAATVAPAVSAAAAEGLGNSLSKGAAVAAVGVTVLVVATGVVAVGAGIYFLGPELAATAKAVGVARTPRRRRAPSA